MENFEHFTLCQKLAMNFSLSDGKTVAFIMNVLQDRNRDIVFDVLMK